MKPIKILKIAVSTMAMGVGVMGAGPVGLSSVASASDEAPQNKAAEAAYDKALKALGKSKFDVAVIEAERAVAYAPNLPSYRMALAQAYLGLGRMSSAEAAFTDVLTLDPSNGKAGLNLALMQIALGRRDTALSTLDQHRETLAASDFGLAVALAGDTSGAVKVLEAAARAPGANAKTRQNLALAYALNGQWAQARVTAALDVSSDQLDLRMTEWAMFARPTSSSEQVASLMNMRPVYDPGQPERLALVVRPQQSAAVAEAPLTVTEAPAEPVLAASPDPAPAFEIASNAVAPMAAPVVASAPVAVPAPAPLIPAPVQPAKQMVVPVKRAAVVRAIRPVESGRFVVQLGAFSNEGRAQIAWDRAAARTRQLDGYGAATARVQVKGASLYRLSVSGFATREDANRVCTRVKASGGDCFVRSIAGDKPMQWVSRGGTRLASRR